MYKIKINCVSVLCSRLANRPDFPMSSSEEEAVSPDLDASSATGPVPGMPEHVSESKKMQRTIKKDEREWESVAMYQKGETAVHDTEETKHLIYESAKKIMEESGLIKLSTHRSKPTDLHLWKHTITWHSDGDTTQNTMYHCPLKTKFGCRCQFKVIHTTNAVYVEKRGVHDNNSHAPEMHDNNSHAPEKDQSKFLKLQQVEAIRTGVVIAPKQSAKHLRR